jgi:hypothetical protein
MPSTARSPRTAQLSDIRGIRPSRMDGDKIAENQALGLIPLALSFDPRLP